MRKLPILTLLLCSFAASTASAAGLAIAWQQCLGDGGTQNRNFACDTNEGSNVLVGSFSLDAALLQVNGNELVVDLCTSTPSLPDWWRFRNAGTCRQAALSIAAHDGIGCPDMFVGQASMNIAAYQIGIRGANNARILSVNAVQEAHVVDLDPSTQYGIARWTITNIKTVGTGACAGCQQPGCIVFNSANITTMGNTNNTRLTSEMGPGYNYVTWRGGNYNCPFVVPTRTTTWSSVKSLYR